VRIAPAALRRLAEHSWPGNVRQLENTVVRALVLAGGDVLEEDCVDFGGAAPPAAGAAAGAACGTLDLRANVEALERGLLERALQAAGGNRTRAAQLLGLSRFGLLKKLQRGATAAPRGGSPTRRGST
jgi:DNA-binding NtrC family response regulator